jgi:uncharacterized phage-like protein YoqJ
MMSGNSTGAYSHSKVRIITPQKKRGENWKRKKKKREAVCGLRP